MAKARTLDLVKNDGKWLVELKKRIGIGKPKKKPPIRFSSM